MWVLPTDEGGGTADSSDTMVLQRSIAIAQTIAVRGDLDANLEEHVQLARLAAQEGAQVVVFPELSLTGYELDLADALAFSENDARLKPLLECACVGQLTLIAGAPARLEARLYIGAFVVTPGGSIDLYTKHHLGAFSEAANPAGAVPPAEASVFHRGGRNPLVRVGRSYGAVAVCADASQPSHPRQAADRGAKTYFASAFVIPADYEEDAGRLRSYASQCSMAVALANYGGPTAGLPSAGRSAIWSQSGELLVQLQESGAGVGIATEDETGWRGRAIMLSA